MQRNAFNTLREQGKDFNTAVALANTMVDVFEEFKPEVPLPEEPVEAPEAVARFETVEELMVDLNDEPAPAPAPKKRAPKKPAPQKKAK
jgi:hypothetical protein